MIYPVVSLLNAVIVVLVLLLNSSLGNAHEVQISRGRCKFALPVIGAGKKAVRRKQWASTLLIMRSGGEKAECRVDCVITIMNRIGLL